MNQYLSLFIYIFIVVSFIFTIIWLSGLLGPKKRNKIKDSPFECGIIGKNKNLLSQRIEVKFFLIAVAFLVFETGIIFIYPWAVYHNELSTESFPYLLFFILILCLCWFYLLCRKVLNWNQKLSKHSNHN